MDTARSFLGDRRGVMALKAALAFPALVVLGAGAIDLQRVQGSKTRLQDIADAAALAGAADLSLATDGSNARERAGAYVQAQLSEWSEAPDVTPVYQVLDDGRERSLKVTLAAHHPSFFMDLLPPGGWNFLVQATATSVGVVPLCVLTTQETGVDVMNLKDQSRMNAPACLVHSNRDITVDGSMIAASVQAVTSARGAISPAAGTGAERIPDPFAGLDLEPTRGLACPARSLIPVRVSNGSHTLAAGKHCGGVEVSQFATLRLAPGDHFFLGGHLVVKDDARLEGEDVALFFDKASRFEFLDRSLVNLDGRKSGAYAGVVMGGTRDNTQNFLISSDNVESLLGVIYVPEAKLVVEGAADVARESAWTVIVAKQLELKGSPSLFINADYDASDVPVPNGVGPRTGGSRLIN